jgi:hypothetical protein
VKRIVFGIGLGLIGWTSGAQLAAQATATTLVHDSTAHTFDILIGPVALPAGGHYHHGAHGGVVPPVATVEVPVDGYLNRLEVRLEDAEGNELPRELLHHLNLNDPDHRELFLPIARRLAGFSVETPPLALPPLLMGHPVLRGQRLDVSSMLHNPTGRDYAAVWVRVQIAYRPMSEGRPMYEVYPFGLDVAFPAGSKAFDLPPGRHRWSNEGSPAIGGTVLGIGSHYHRMVRYVAMEDVTGGRVLWLGCPAAHGDRESDIGHRGASDPAAGRLYEAAGFGLDPAHVYRITVEYDNPAADTILDGGMGAIGGVFLPATGAEWPPVDPSDPLYLLDRRHYREEIEGRWTEIGGSLKSRADVSAIRMDEPLSNALAARGPEPCATGSGVLRQP